MRTKPAGNVKGTKLPPEPLTQEEARALLNACSRRGPTGIRNRALIVLLWRAGLRVSEALALKPADVDLEAGTVRVLRGKGSKARTAGIDPSAGEILARWMDARAALGVNGRAPLICGISSNNLGKPVAPAYVRALLPRLAEKAGITKRVHPHGLRHTHATELRQEGVEIGVISRQLGHSDIATTVRYLSQVAPQAVVDTMRRRGGWDAETSEK